MRIQGRGQRDGIHIYFRPSLLRIPMTSISPYHLPCFRLLLLITQSSLQVSEVRWLAAYFQHCPTCQSQWGCTSCTCCLKEFNLSKGSSPIKINSQSLEDTQVGYISQKYTLDKYSLEEYTLEEFTLENF